MATFNSANGSMQASNKTLFETICIADAHGRVLDVQGSIGAVIDIAKGLHPDITFSHRTGYIQAGFGNGDTVWDDASPYPWSSLATAQTLYIKSSTNNASDRGQYILIEGLDGDYEIQTEEVTLNASNSAIAVTSTKQFLRINDVKVNNGTVNEGDIQVRVTSSSGTLVQIIPAGFGRSMVGIYTVPAGYTGYLLKGVCSSTSATVIGFYVKEFEKGFKLQHVASVDNSTYNYDFPVPLPFLEKTDMDVRGIVAAGRTTVNWDMLLYKN